MRWHYKLPLRLRSLFRKNSVEQELSEEIRFHLEKLIQENVAHGMTLEEARYAALRELGGIEQTKEECRDMRRVNFIEDLLRDVGYGLRQLRRNPGFTTVAIITLALGIGANTAIFSVVHAVLLNSLPYHQPQRLVTLAESNAETINPRTVSYATLEDWKRRSRSFQSIAAYEGWTPTLTNQHPPKILFGLRVSYSFFHTLGVAPYLGHAFTTQEDRPDRWHVVLLSYPYWIQRFAGNPKVLGQTLQLDSVPFEIVGVLPRRFRSTMFTDAGGPPDVWAPLGYDLAVPDACRTCRHLRSVARLKTGVSLGQARSEINSIEQQLAREFPKDYAPDAGVAATSLRERWLGKEQTALWLLLGATVLVLMIGCANIANLMLARAAGKRREVALRCALGASRLRIIRQLVTEGALVSLLGGAAGVLLASWVTTLLIHWGPTDIPRLAQSHTGAAVLLFALVISISTGVLMALTPALQASRVDHREAMQASSPRQAGASRGRSRRLLIVAEVSLAFVLTTASGLLLNSFAHVENVNPGFDVKDLYEVNLALVGPKYRHNSAIVQFDRELLGRIRALPAIQAAGITSTVPLGGGFDQRDFNIQERHIYESQTPSVDAYFVSPDYFRAMGIKLRRGRLFTEADAESGSPVAIISEATAREVWPGKNPIGERIELGSRNEKGPWARIVGVVDDVHQYGLDFRVTPQAYELYSQEPFPRPVLMVRSGMTSRALTRDVETQVWAMDKSTAVFNPFPLEDIMSHSVARRRFTMALFGAFGALALILAAVGIYGVMSYTVAQRTKEIGIRIALGAQRTAILRMVFRETCILVTLGLAAGIAISFATGRLIASQLFAVRPTDAMTLVSAIFVLAGVSWLATYIPARRATKIDPMIALRHE